MLGLCRNSLILLLLLLPTAVIFVGQGGRSSILVYAEEAGDVLEGEDDDATVDSDEPVADDGAESDLTATEKEEDDTRLKPSPHVDTIIHFVRPNKPSELPAGRLVRLLVGFTNNGESDFVVESMDASFRYPQDYSFYLQNFTTVGYSQVVEPKRQATFEYGFTPSDAFSGRPFGLSIMLNYKDSNGAEFANAIYNETITVVEPEEGLDAETFFLYVFLAAAVVLLLIGAQQLMASFKKKPARSKTPVEMGTQNSDIDYDWIPKEALINHSPRRTPKQSPRQRRSKRSTGFGEE
ncbi:translocon-associated protein subunit alpha isoform X2 [Patella vulgata]|uniref:translocon-associated protein subunit alpha isoform X2 n=1 Tax=Patella vulgata TaxID=6465 RepID=UPI00218086E4|nr:translocon-associated protein subunit alpha isoform X2 [Patella vulgata]